MKEERLKTDSSCLAMTDAEQGELYETIRHALHSLRKHKVNMASTHSFDCEVGPRDCEIIWRTQIQINHNHLKNFKMTMYHLT